MRPLRTEDYFIREREVISMLSACFIRIYLKLCLFSLLDHYALSKIVDIEQLYLNDIKTIVFCAQRNQMNLWKT